MYKYLSAVLLSVMSCSLQAQELSTFKQVAEAISVHGNGLRVVTNLKKCDSLLPLPLLDVVSTGVFNHVALIEGRGISFSDTRLVEKSFPQSQILYVSTDYTLSDNNSFTISSNFFDVHTYQRVGDTEMTKCLLGESVKFYTV